MTINSDILQRLQVRLHQHLAVLSKDILCVIQEETILVYIVLAITIQVDRRTGAAIGPRMLEIVALVCIFTIALANLHTFIECSVFLKGTIYISLITATIDVTVTIGHT